MAEQFEVRVDGMKEIADLVQKIGQDDTAVRMNREIGLACAELTADHIAAKVSPTHHKSADRLGAVHSGFFEFARGRQGFYQGKEHAAGEVGFIESRGADKDGVSVVIGNTPGMTRVFHALEIKPKKARRLTIPIHRDAYSLRVKDLKAAKSGIRLFRVTTKRGKEILMGTEGKGKTQVTRPYYALVKSVKVPQDRSLLPTREEYADKAVEAAEAFAEVELL